MIRVLRVALAAGAVAWACDAWAAPPEAQPAAPEGATTVSFRMQGDEIKVPIPVGYCEPQDPYSDVAPRLDAMDSSTTFEAFYDCAEMAQHKLGRYVVLRTPRAWVLERKSRGPFLAEETKKARTNTLEDTEKAARAVAAVGSARLGKNIELEMGLNYLGTDDVGVYRGGAGQSVTNGTERKFTMVGALTVIKGHPLGYLFYGSGSTAADLSNLLQMAKAETHRLTAANGG